MKLDKNQQAFFALLRAGLWEQEVRLVPYGEIDFLAVLDLAEEQSVVRLLAAGIEHVVDGRPAKRMCCSSSVARCCWSSATRR